MLTLMMKKTPIFSWNAGSIQLIMFILIQLKFLILNKIEKEI